MKKSKFFAVTCTFLKMRENWRLEGAIGFTFASNWLKSWREIFKPITKRYNDNHVISFEI